MKGGRGQEEVEDNRSGSRVKATWEDEGEGKGERDERTGKWEG